MEVTIKTIYYVQYGKDNDFNYRSDLLKSRRSAKKELIKWKSENRYSSTCMNATAYLVKAVSFKDYVWLTDYPRFLAEASKLLGVSKNDIGCLHGWFFRNADRTVIM